jgi:hypothetical protein
MRDAKGQPCKSTILEELIDASQGEFRKFVHNGSALPLLLPDDDDYDLACFLCFCQHVQWSKTGSLAFVSDFQGKPDPL